MSGFERAAGLFKSDGRFVARLADGVVQATGDSPREALSGLRSAVVQYRRVYEANGAQPARRLVPYAPLSPSKAQLARHAVYVHNSLRGSDRFWKTSSAGMANARCSFQLGANGGAE